MCGIVGIYKKSGVNKINFDLSLNAIAHRGPDASVAQYFLAGQLALGHRRLSIIDLSSAANQPMNWDDKGLSIVFNGEIYNFKELKQELINLHYQFNTSSDTEVLLYAYNEWGKQCVSKLNGMFAFCIYDKIKKQLFLARDRAGEKPLFYSIKEDGFYFASEIKALLAYNDHSPEIDLHSLDLYLAQGFTEGSKSMLKGISKLAPAHTLTYSLLDSKYEIERYWTLPKNNYSNTNFGIDELALRCGQLLKDSISKQLVSDVPLGILLSGGVDSSLITALAAESGSKIKTYTVTFPGFSKFDESSHAQLIADYFSTQHTILEASSIEPNLLLLLAKQYDEPMIDSSMIPTYLVSKEIKKHCTVALGGDGGDELFGGYGHYDRLLYMSKQLQHIPKFIKHPLSIAAGFLPIGFKGKTWFRNINTDFENKLPLVASYFDIDQRKHLISSNLDWKPIAEESRKNSLPNGLDLLDRATRADFLNYLPEDILVKVDRASMLNSLEIRAPFLDHRIIEFAFSEVPSKFKTTIKSRKILLKKLTEKLLPPAFDKQRKQGFGVPIGLWFRKGKWNQFLKEILLLEPHPFNKKYIEYIIKRHENGAENAERLFGLLLFVLWAKEYNVKIS